jgi:DNA polymerase III epsilon subunit family exonuclease
MSETLDSLHNHEIRNLPIVSVDVEATGLEVESGDRIVELAVVKRYPDGSIEHWSSLVNPKIHIPFITQQIHGINDAMVADAPLFSDLHSRINSLIKDSIFIAHNAEFDVGFIQTECKLSDSPPIHIGPVLDTLQMSRNFYGLPHNNLTSVAHRFQLLVHSAHRALHDAHNTMYAFLGMLDDLEDRFQQNLTCKSLQQLIINNAKYGKIKQGIKQNIRKAYKSKQSIIIEYVSGDPRKPLRSLRKISILKLDFPQIIAHCHLRNAERTFRLKRIQQAYFTSEEVPK